MSEGDTLVNAVLGGVAAIVLSFVPLSPVLGGAIAGYLQGGSRNDGLRVGALSGLVAAIPLGFVVVGLLLVTGLFALGVGPRGGAGIAVFLLFSVVGLVLVALYTVGLGAVGGWIGNYVKHDTDLGESGPAGG